MKPGHLAVNFCPFPTADWHKPQKVLGCMFGRGAFASHAQGQALPNESGVRVSDLWTTPRTTFWPTVLALVVRVLREVPFTTISAGSSKPHEAAALMAVRFCIAFYAGPVRGPHVPRLAGPPLWEPCLGRRALRSETNPAVSESGRGKHPPANAGRGLNLR